MMASLLSIIVAAAVLVKQEVTAEALHPSIISRLLEDDGGSDSDGDSSSPKEQDTGGGMGNDRFQFVAFLLWYIFLVFCCVVPTCCAYHRRRRVEQRLAVQQANLNRLQHSNLFILSNLQRHSVNNERVQQERLRILTEELKETTMVRVWFAWLMFNFQPGCHLLQEQDLIVSLTFISINSTADDQRWRFNRIITARHNAIGRRCPGNSNNNNSNNRFGGVRGECHGKW